MADFWRDLVWTAVRDTVGTLRVVMPSVLAMLTLVALGAALGWVTPSRFPARRAPRAR